jgi:MacB-like periplasmic core domain
MPDWTKYIRQNLHLHGLRPDREAEIIEDLAQQLEDAYREALAGGMAEAEAAAFARQHVPDWDSLNRELRPPRAVAPALEHLQESADAASRSRRWWAPLGGLLRDLLFGLRMMRKNPGFTLVVVLTLALGIGAASAIFGVVNAVLLRPLPYPSAERLAIISELGHMRNRAPETFSVSWQDYQDWRKQVRSLEHLGVFRTQNANLTRVNPPDRLLVSMTSADVFNALGVRPLLGRAFVPEEDEPDAAATVILSETMWRSRFGAAPDILERTITLDGMNYQVVGVMSDSVRFPARVDCWVPLGQFVNTMPPERGTIRGLPQSGGCVRA